MKKLLLLVLPILLLALVCKGQAPGIFNYQGVARNSVGNVLESKPISLRLSIHDGAANGPIVYSETRAVTTNPFGLFNVQVGSSGATNVTGTILTVNWAVGDKFIQVEIDPLGGSAFINIGTAQLASVPFALSASGASPMGPAGGDLSGAYPNPTIGRLHGRSLLDIAPLNGQTIMWNGTLNQWEPGLITAAGPAGGDLTGTYPNPTINRLQGRNILNIVPLNGQSLVWNGLLSQWEPGLVTPIGPAGGDLSGTYPNPTISRLQGRNVLNVAPTNGQTLVWNGGLNQWEPGSGAAATLVLPFTANENSATDLLTINNAGAGTSIVGTNASTTSSVTPIKGEIVSTAPGGFSSAIRGLNNGTGGLGIGVWGSQAGSGWGVYGVTPNGLGVYGNSSANGYGVFGNSTSGVGIYGTSTDGTPGQFTITNNTNGNAALTANTLSDGAAIEGITSSTSSSVTAIRGLINSTAPGGFSSAVRGLNNGTGGLGIGVWGSQAGSGWGVYGVTPNGLGVYGNSSAGGYGVFANSTTGTGLYATSTSGIAANFLISNNANNSNVIDASSLGNGTVVNVSSSGSGKGIFSTTGAGFAVQGVTTSQSSAGIIGDNNGGGEAVVGRNNSNIAGAVVGRNDGGGYGVRGFVTTNTTGTSVGVFGQVGLNNGRGRAGRFENLNATNNINNTFEVETNGNGNIPDRTQGNAANFLVNNSNSVAAAVRGQVNTIFGNFGAAAIFGEATGTGGFAGLFYQQNPTGNGPALVALTDGNGNAITANSEKNGNGVESSVNGTGSAVYGWAPTFSTGRAARFNHYNTANTSTVLTATTVGNGIAGDFFVDNTNGTSAAVKGTVNSIFANFGTAGVYGRSDGTGGFAGLFYQSNPAGNGPALIALAEGNGNAITANASNSGDGVETTVDGTGNALYAWTPTFSAGRAARLVNFNAGNTNPVLTVETHSNGNIALFKSGNPGTVNVARIDATGRGFFNNGTQVGGADMAEMFDVSGSTTAYEAGDILVISTSKDRAVEKSSTPYSILVAGVYATKPGVILSEDHVDADHKDKIPMGVVGVIPTKVCLEGGAIKRGDILVTSSIPGVAMKADRKRLEIGQALGKALQDYDTAGVGKINVLVSVK